MQMEEIISTAGSHTKETTGQETKYNPNEGQPSTVEPRDKARLDEAKISDTGRNMAEYDKTLEDLKKYVGRRNLDIEFAEDDETGSLIIRVVDRETGETLRQIPPEEMLKLRSRMQEILGLIFDHMA